MSQQSVRFIVLCEVSFTNLCILGDPVWLSVIAFFFWLRRQLYVHET